MTMQTVDQFCSSSTLFFTQELLLLGISIGTGQLLPKMLNIFRNGNYEGRITEAQTRGGIASLEP